MIEDETDGDCVEFRCPVCEHRVLVNYATGDLVVLVPGPLGIVHTGGSGGVSMSVSVADGRLDDIADSLDTLDYTGL